MGLRVHRICSIHLPTRVRFDVCVHVPYRLRQNQIGSARDSRSRYAYRSDGWKGSRRSKSRRINKKV